MRWRWFGKGGCHLVEELRSKGTEVEILMFEDAGHDVLKVDNRVKCSNAIADFFGSIKSRREMGQRVSYLLKFTCSNRSAASGSPQIHTRLEISEF
jgi:hypothetical protein